MNSPLPNLQKDIVRTMAYFDVFSYPLTKEQVYSFLSRNSVTLGQLEHELNALVRKGLLKEIGGYYFFSDRPSVVVESRRQDEQRATVMLKRAFWISLFLKQVPFVRAIFITGSLSKNVASRSSDVDFMIVTAPNRLWISKMIITGFRRIFLFNSIKYFCVNLFVTEKGFTFPEKNVFNAIEIATTQVLWNKDAHENFRSANAWISGFLPNWSAAGKDVRTLSNQNSPLQRTAEFLLDLFPLARIDAFLLKTAHSFWKKRNAHLTEEKFNSLFQCKPDVSSVWSHDHQTQTLHQFHRRLSQFGIS